MLEENVSRTQGPLKAKVCFEREQKKKKKLWKRRENVFNLRTKRKLKRGKIFTYNFDILIKFIFGFFLCFFFFYLLKRKKNKKIPILCKLILIITYKGLLFQFFFFNFNFRVRSLLAKLLYVLQIIYNIWKSKFRYNWNFN